METHGHSRPDARRRRCSARNGRIGIVTWVFARDAIAIFLWSGLGWGGGGRRRWRQHPSLHDRGKAASVVGPVAKRLVGGLATAAERDHGTSGQIEGSSFLVDDGELPFVPDGTIVADGDDGARHALLPSDVSQSRPGGRDLRSGLQYKPQSHVPAPIPI